MSLEPSQTYTYNHLGQLIQVTDAAGTRTIGYNEYGEQKTDSLAVGGKTHLITEKRDQLGRSTGYTYAKDGIVEQNVFTGYGDDGRISTSGFLHGGEEKQFGFSYLKGTNLLQTLTKPNGITFTQTYEEKRDLIAGMYYKKGSTAIVGREYTYDSLGRPLTRRTARKGTITNDSFAYNTRSELAAATVDGGNYSYDYDNIGNRKRAEEATRELSYGTSNLNQYTSIQEREGKAFVPAFDADGNQTVVKTSTGVWKVVYNAANRPVTFTKTEGNMVTVVTCTYDSMGRRSTKKVEVITAGQSGERTVSVTLHQRYLYRGYLQIACCDLTHSSHPCLWFTVWDPSETLATRLLAIIKEGSWCSSGWDLTKNVCEVFDSDSPISTSYSYSPYGEVIAEGNVKQPFLWSSEYYDTELSLVYYNYRHYNPHDGRWINRDYITEHGGWNLYGFVGNNPVEHTDRSGLFIDRLASAVGSAAIDIGIQVTTNIIEGKPAGDIDWISVGATAISGAIVPGVGVIKSCKKLGETLAKNKKVVTKVVQLQNKINTLEKYGELKSITKIQYEQSILIQTNNYMWAYYLKEEFTMHTFKIVNKELAKGIIQSWGIKSDLDKMEDCIIQVIIGQRTSVEATAERLSTPTTPPTLPPLPSRPWPALN